MVEVDRLVVDPIDVGSVIRLGNCDAIVHLEKVTVVDQSSGVFNGGGGGIRLVGGGRVRSISCVILRRRRKESAGMSTGLGGQLTSRGW